MADFIHIQDVFSKGELSPTMYARVTSSIYNKALKRAKNILPIPQGGARKRFGTLFRSELQQSDYTQVYPVIYEYSNQCIYQLVFYDNSIDIYLEGLFIDTVTDTNIDGNDLVLIDEINLDNQILVTTGFQAPYYLTRSANTPNVISSINVAGNIATIANPFIFTDVVLPASFTTTSILPTSNPQIKTGRVYFIYVVSSTTFQVYQSATDAAAQINPIVFLTTGIGNSLVVQNTWTFAPVPFTNLPTYDFNGGYESITFTPSVTTGTGNLVASATWGASGGFTTQFIGGIFTGGGGIARITAITNTTTAVILVIQDFSGTTAISGQISVLTEPAWSNARGWPNVCGSYQNRAIYANTESLPNGLWFSSINTYEDFDDSTLDNDQAISWYPTSEFDSTIDFITPYRSLIVHTDAGVLSTPLLSDTAITPTNFSLTLQDSTPSTGIQPVTIDNQLMIISGRDVNSLIWEFGQSAYVPNLISAVSEHLITTPIAMVGFRDRTTTGGRYLFIINSDNGTMAMYQTLLSEEIAGWTWAQTEQSYGTSNFRGLISSVLGRCWFIVERQVAEPQAPITITGFNAGNNTLQSIGSNFSLTVPVAALFIMTGTLPTTVPQINTAQYYWVLGVDANDFMIFAAQSDALAYVLDPTSASPIGISSAGSGSLLAAYPLVTVLNLEELSYNVNTDCAIVTTGTNITSVAGLDIFAGQNVTVKADGRVYDSNPVINGDINITIMGTPASVNSVEVGYPISYEFQPLPISIPLAQDPHTSNLAQAKHIRFVNIMLANSIGGQINNQNITLQTLNNFNFNAPSPQTGIMQVSLMQGWNQFRSPSFTITQSDPYDFNLIGLFYMLEV